MIQGLIRSPCSYFDITPSGRLNNNFSNDLGVLDNTLGFVVIDSMQGIIVALSTINIFFINLYLLIPGIISMVFIGYFFGYCKKSISSVKQLDLKLKTPVFSMTG